MTTSCSLRMLLLVSLLTGPSTCRGNFVQHAITDVLSWARHELAAWTHSAAPLSEGEVAHMSPHTIVLFQFCELHAQSTLVRGLMEARNFQQAAAYAGFGPQCIDAQGHAVEWWVAVKPPSTTDLLYVDSRTPEADPTQWRFRWGVPRFYAYACSISTTPSFQDLFTLGRLFRKGAVSSGGDIKSAGFYRRCMLSEARTEVVYGPHPAVWSRVRARPQWRGRFSSCRAARESERSGM